jgi:hypothetical protein
MKIKLIENWKKALKMWSVRLSTMGASIMGMFLYFPEWSLWLYNMMPTEIREMIPDRAALYLAMFVFIGTALARIVKQEKLKPSTDNTDTPMKK